MALSHNRILASIPGKTIIAGLLLSFTAARTYSFLHSSFNMVPQTQRAMVVTEIGKPLSMVTDRPVPRPRAGQVLVKVSVAGANPHDQKSRDWGLFIANSLPAVITNDVAGKVVALGGADVTKLSVGDRIVGHPDLTGRVQSGTQEYAVLDAAFSAKIPEGFTDDDGATLPTNVIAPLVALFHPQCLGIPAPWTSEATTFDYKNTTVLIVGGGSNCGIFGVQLAAIAGVGRIVTIGGDEKYLKSLGATHIIDRHGSQEEILKKIRDIVGDELIYAYDAISPPPEQALAANALSSTKRGKLARLLPLGPIDEALVHPKKEGFELINVFGSSKAKAELAEPFWDRVPQYLKEGKLKPTKYTVLEGFSVDNVNKVLDAYKNGEKVTKTHLHFP